MRDSRTAEPFSPLGKRLRSLRNQASETLAETSGAVEIEVAQLVSFELGKARPSEEILLLLINHFKPRDTDALKIWKLAGYSNDELPAADDIAAVYTDTIEVKANRFGLVVDFKQTSPGSELPKSIAKVGMSREHAESLVKTLSIALAQTKINQSKLLRPDDEQQP